MIRLVILLLFFWILPVISNAAGIYENVEDFPIKSQKTNAPSTSNDEKVSVYETELVLILQKHNLLQQVQENTDTTPTHYGIEDKNSSFIETIVNNDVDARVLLETEATWKEIKNKLDYLNIFFNKIDMWAEDFLANNIDTNLILISDNNEIKHANKVKNLRSHKNTEKHDSLLALNKVNNRSNSSNSSNSSNFSSSSSSSSSNEKIDYGKNTFNLLYIWEKYSDIIIGVLVVIGLWSAVRSLINITSR